jgi:hypothetical protein
MPYVTSNPPIILSASSCRGSKRCVIVFCSALIFSISPYNCLFTRMVNMRSMVAKCLFFHWIYVPSPVHFLLFPLFPSSLDSLSIVSKFVFFLHIASHSSPRLLMFLTEVINVFLFVPSPQVVYLVWCVLPTLQSCCRILELLHYFLYLLLYCGFYHHRYLRNLPIYLVDGLLYPLILLFSLILLLQYLSMNLLQVFLIHRYLG